LPGSAWIDLAPDWVCEILSPAPFAAWFIFATGGMGLLDQPDVEHTLARVQRQLVSD
jgi:hypothetical protein